MNTLSIRAHHVRIALLSTLFIVVLFASQLHAFSAHAAQGINEQIPFSGILRDDKGKALTGTFDMQFSLYAVATNGAPVWTGNYTSANGNAVSVKDGYFSVMLGSGAGNALTVDFAHDTYYLGITIVGDVEMTPRERIGASAYAFNSDLLDGFHAADFFRDGSALSLTASSDADALLTLTQTGTGNILSGFADGSKWFTINNTGNIESFNDATNTFSGFLNVLSGEPSYFDAGIHTGAGSSILIGDQSEISFGTAADALTLSYDLFYPNDLIFGLRGSAADGNAVNLMSPSALSLTANYTAVGQLSYPKLVFNEDGGAQLLNSVDAGDGLHNLEMNFVDGIRVTGLGATSFENSSVEILDNQKLYFGSHDDGGSGELGGVSMFVDNVDQNLGSNVLVLDTWGSYGDHSVDITTPNKLGLFGGSYMGSGISLFQDGNLSISGSTTNQYDLLTIEEFNQGVLISSGDLTVSSGNLTVSSGDIIVSTGDVYAHGIALTSDGRLKDNIITITNALDTVRSLRGVHYEWKDKERFGTQAEVGFIAQEVQEEIPEVVTKNGDYYGIKIQNIVAVVVEAIKELNTKVENYFTRTERLEREVERLQQEINALKGGSSPTPTTATTPVVEEQSSTTVPDEILTEPVVDTSTSTPEVTS